MLLTKKLKADTVIFQEGSLDKTMFLVLEGKVQIYSTHNGHEIELSVIKENEFFGEIEMFHKKPRATSAKALTNVRLAYIKNRMQLEQLIAQNPSFSGKMVRMMGERLANTTALLP